MEGKHLHGDEWNHHIRKWGEKKQNLELTSPCFSLEKLHKKANSSVHKCVFSLCLLLVCILKKISKWFPSSVFLHKSIGCEFCHFNTNDTTYRRRSVMKSSGGIWQVFLLKWSPVRPAFAGRGESRRWLPEVRCTQKLNFQGRPTVHVKLTFWHLLPEIYRNAETASDLLALCLNLRSSGHPGYLMKVLNFRLT